VTHARESLVSTGGGPQVRVLERAPDGDQSTDNDRGQGRTRCSDGEAGRNQQHRERGDVAGIDAVRTGRREQHLALGERFHDHQPDSHGGQHQRQDPAPTAGLPTARHSVDCSGSVLGRRLSARRTKISGSDPALTACRRHGGWPASAKTSLTHSIWNRKPRDLSYPDA
jgi:hypothetical protein